jgi:hypothetical protein
MSVSNVAGKRRISGVGCFRRSARGGGSIVEQRRAPHEVMVATLRRFGRECG